MKSIIKLGFVLAAFAVISCSLLAVVNNWTAPKIEAIKAEKTAKGLKQVYPDAETFEAVTDFPKKAGTTQIAEVYNAIVNGNKEGIVIKATGSTYDKSTLLIGVKNTEEGSKLTGVVFLECSDSPGFGQKACDPAYKTSSGTTFYGQFADMAFNGRIRMNQDFEAISGATITSRGVETIINDALTVNQQ